MAASLEKAVSLLQTLYDTKFNWGYVRPDGKTYSLRREVGIFLDSIKEPKMQVKVKKLFPNAQLPVYSSNGAAGFDLFAHNVSGDSDPFKYEEQGMIVSGWQSIISKDNGCPSRMFGTGLSIEVPKGHVLLVFSRSGMGVKHGITLVNSVGVIDSDYRGEVCVPLINQSDKQYIVRMGDRIAQGIIIPYPEVEFIESEELSETDRGVNGHGSTGV